MSKSPISSDPVQVEPRVGEDGEDGSMVQLPCVDWGWQLPLSHIFVG